MGDLAGRLLTTKRLDNAINFFENSIKRAFNPYDSTCEDEFDVLLSIPENVPRIGLEDGYLKVTKYLRPI
jgi:hypothetical protein